MQTIGYPYMKLISELVYIINNHIEVNKQNDYLIKLLQIHNNNIEYEKINPPIWYGGKKAKHKFEKEYKVKAPREKKTRQKGPSAAEKKLVAKVAKINALSIKIKPVN